MRSLQVARRRARARDEGSIAVMGALIIPVVLGVIALALSTLVWGASETEVQRASDQAALEAAASALLTDFPYASLSPVPALYPSVQKVAPGVDPLASMTSACTALGNPIAAATAALPKVPQTITQTVTGPLGLPVTTTVTVTNNISAVSQAAIDAATAALPSDLKNALATIPSTCNGLTGTTTPIPQLPDSSLKSACDTAAENVSGSSAPYSVNFFGGNGGSTPTCANGRVFVTESTGSPLLGLDPATVNTNSGVTVNGQQVSVPTVSVPNNVSTVQTALAALGVHLDTVLPNALCPQVSVGVDQPVKGVISGVSVPNGRSTAKRVMKNVVVVPVFNGRTLATATADATLSGGVNAGLASTYTTVTAGVSQTVTTPALDLNSTVLDYARPFVLKALGDVDNRINQTLAATNATVQGLAGTTSAVSLTQNINVGVNGNNTSVSQTNPTVSASLSSLDLLKCVRQSVSELYDPPTSGGQAAPSTKQVLADAAKAGEPITIVQIGMQPCDSLGAVVASAVNSLTCMQAALGNKAVSAINTVTGLYDIPVLDVTPAVVRDVGNGNYEAVPVHATQANGAFRATLVRGTADNRYVP